MNGEQKTWTLIVLTIASLLGWVAWNVRAHADLATISQPTSAAVLYCVDQCALSCAGGVTLEDVE